MNPAFILRKIIKLCRWLFLLALFGGLLYMGATAASARFNASGGSITGDRVTSSGITNGSSPDGYHLREFYARTAGGTSENTSGGTLEHYVITSAPGHVPGGFSIR